MYPLPALKLRPLVSTAEKPSLHLRCILNDREQDLYLPNIDGIDFYIPPRGSPTLTLESRDLAVETLGTVGSLGCWLASRFVTKPKNKLRHEALTIYLSGRRGARRKVANALRFLAENGISLYSPGIVAHPELFTGLEQRPGATRVVEPTRATTLRMAVAIHLHYGDLWPEFQALLAALPPSVHPIVTLTPNAADVADHIRTVFPEATVRLVENRGRDISPFLTLIEDGTLEAYDIVCKLHGKRSLGTVPILGELWRRKMMLDLLADPASFAAVVRRFETNGNLGMIGPRGFRKFRSPVRDDEWTPGEDSPRAILRRLGHDVGSVTPDFFAGTMFWVRPAALRGLREHAFSSDFAPESGGNYHGREVAFEVVFAEIVKRHGFTVEDIDAFSPSNG